ncbi:MAG: HEPN domain-containing protein [Selenomonadaceae bacterium]|nr:HEPN domain-containing protein [Selenomonadaceae bacterium]
MEHENDKGSISDLVKYRLEKARENLAEAEGLYELNLYSGANNRIYYSVFNAILAVHALDSRATASHKRAIGEFNRI